MLKIKIITGILFCTLSILTSCGKNEENYKVEKPEIPEALQEKSIDLKRYSRDYGDLMEELYQELVVKSAELKSLETEFEEFKSDEPKNIFFDYNRKSIDYYNSSKNRAELINDSVTKNKIIALIKKSNDKYFYKTIELNGLVKEVSSKNNSLEDYHNILKIILTIPIIEKYQNENLPNKSEFKKVIKKQEDLISKTKTVTPKY